MSYRFIDCSACTSFACCNNELLPYIRAQDLSALQMQSTSQYGVAKGHVKKHRETDKLREKVEKQTTFWGTFVQMCVQTRSAE